MSTAITIEFPDLEELEARINRLAGIDFTQLLDDVGGRMASVAKGRIEETKAGPDGTPWPAWSPKYAKGRRSGASLLFDEDNLRFDIHHVVEGNRVEVGSNIPYAGVHQHGSKQATGRGGGIPARPYLGMSAEDEADIVLLAQDFVSDLLEGSL